MAIAYLMITAGAIMGVICVSMAGAIISNREIRMKERIYAVMVLLLFVAVSVAVFVGGIQLYNLAKM